jgi:hypothetical protein
LRRCRRSSFVVARLSGKRHLVSSRLRADSRKYGSVAISPKSMQIAAAFQSASRLCCYLICLYLILPRILSGFPHRVASMSRFQFIAAIGSLG